ncbi:hypothetical protein [uncultured Sphingomonas sp.]|uniref:hypothetical protein n=1 Tax=uncultured Sphingomonas sp. TaxID=158754 RepID=UPI0035CA4DBF
MIFVAIGIAVPLVAILIAYVSGTNPDHLGGVAIVAGIFSPLLSGILLVIWSSYCIVVPLVEKWSTDNDSSYAVVEAESNGRLP